jgi:hypothetical protein
VKTVVKSGVNTADINRLRPDYYNNLFYKYKAKIENEHPNKKYMIISECQKDQEFNKLNEQEQQDIFFDLMAIERKLR